MIGRTVVVIVFFASWGFAQGQLSGPESTPSWLEWQLELRWGGDFGGQVKALRNIPESYRTVPWHPDDDNTRSRFAVIPDNNLNPRTILSFNYILSTGFMIQKRVALRIGMGFAGLGDDGDYGPGNSGGIREIDIYSGEFERGYGRSLVYYAVKLENWQSWKPYLLFEAEVKIIEVKDGHINLLFGGWSKSCDYVIARGWDRYDALQTLDQLHLAKMTLTHYYAGIRFAIDRHPAVFPAFMFTIGPTNSIASFAPQAQGTQIHGSHSIMFGLTVDIIAVVKTW